MAFKKFYIGSEGPYFYDDADPVNDPDGDFSGEYQKAGITDGKYKQAGKPTEPDDLVRLQDLPVITGMILMWSGSISDIPSGWTLCDGTDGAPDLTDRFILGAGNSYSPGDSGGSDSKSLTDNELPSHSHSMDLAGSHNHGGSTGTDGSHDHSYDYASEGYSSDGNTFRNLDGTGSTGSVDSAGSHSHSIGSDGSHSHNINSTGSGNSFDIKPPYYALAFIMKL